MSEMNDELLAADDVAKFLKVSASHFNRRLASLPTFPKARRLPTEGDRGTPRWWRSEVKEWVDGLPA